MFMGPRNRCQGMNSASLCSLAGRYENPIPPRCLAPIDFLKIPALILLLFPGRKTVSRTRLSTKPFFLPVFRIIRGKGEVTSYRFVFYVLVLLKINKFFVLETLIRKPTGSQALKVIQLQGIEKGNRTSHLWSWLVGYLFLLYALSHMHTYTPIPTFIHPSTITNLDTCSVHPVKGTVSRDGYF